MLVACIPGLLRLEIRPMITGLFIDLVNSTGLHQDPRLGRTQPERDRAFETHLKAPYDEAVALAVREAGGWIVNPAGDGWCCALPEPQEAVLCALVLQHRLQRRLADTPVGPVLARVGLHVGSSGTQPRHYIHDAGNGRIVSVKLDYHATERVSLGGASRP